MFWRGSPGTNCPDNQPSLLCPSWQSLPSPPPPPRIWLCRQGPIHQSHARKPSDITDHQSERLTHRSEWCCRTRLTGFQQEAETLDISALLGSLIKCKCWALPNTDSRQQSPGPPTLRS